MSHRLLLVLCLTPSVVGTLAECVLVARNHREAPAVSEPASVPIPDQVPFTSLAAFQAERPTKPVSLVVFVHLTENHGLTYADATHFLVSASSPAGERGSGRFYVARATPLGKSLLECLRDGHEHRLTLTVLHPAAGEDEILRFAED